MKHLLAISFRVLEVGLALLLFWSAVEHLKNPYVFLSNILKYDLLGQMALVFAVVLPVWQLLLAALLVLGEARLAATACTAGLLSVFVVAQGSALIRGLGIDCGCFGVSHSEPISLMSVGRITALAVVAWCLFWAQLCKYNVSTKVKVSPSNA